MKIAIITFQFAHNYGAMLQAFALKQFLEREGHSVSFVPYYPRWAKRIYAVSPLEKGISIKKRIKLTLNYKGHKYQSKLFESFKNEYLGCSSEFENESKIDEFLEAFDLLICGSDQIWNDKITGDIKAYYGENSHIRKVSYAASLGTKKLTDIQIRNAKQVLPGFDNVSVREETSRRMLESYVYDINVVMDPVFLLSKEEWKKEQGIAKINVPYMLVYLLQEDNKLLEYAKEYAKENSLKMIQVHPTTATYHDGCIRWKMAGPKEFLALICHAQCVCTNSFHATSFSVIYQKKLIHIPNKVSPDRTISLLNRIGEKVKNEENAPIYDFDDYNYSCLQDEIDSSKAWLLNVIEGNNS